MVKKNSCPVKDSKYIETFLSFLRSACTQARQSAEDWQEADKQTQDILHRLELYADGYHETAGLGKLLRQVRQRRRKAKEAYERTNPNIRLVPGKQGRYKEPGALAWHGAQGRGTAAKSDVDAKDGCAGLSKYKYRCRI